MLVVLAVIATMAALAWPAMRKPLGKWKLGDAAKQLRAELGRVRLEAIETGRTFQVRYLPGSGIYRVEPAHAGPDVARRMRGRASVWAGRNAEFFGSAAPDDDHLTGDHRTSGQSGRAMERAERRNLPDDIVFAAPYHEENEQASLDLDELEDMSDHDWSAPIIFYPNGRTSDAVIGLVGDRDYRIQLTLRGLTGAIQVGDLQPPFDQLDDRSARGRELDSEMATFQRRASSPISSAETRP